MLIISLTIIASLFYVLATSHVLSRLFHHQGPSQKVTIILSTVAILAHMLLLVNSVFRAVKIPVLLTLVSSSECAHLPHLGHMSRRIRPFS